MINEAQMNAMIAELILQRDAATNRLLGLVAEVVLLRSEIEVLKEKHSKKEGEADKP